MSGYDVEELGLGFVRLAGGMTLDITRQNAGALATEDLERYLSLKASREKEMASVVQKFWGNVLWAMCNEPHTAVVLVYIYSYASAKKHKLYEKNI